MRLGEPAAAVVRRRLLCGVGDMNGQRIHSLPKFPLAPAIFLIIAAVFAIWSAASTNPHLTVFALLPLTIAAALFLARERRFEAELCSDAMDIKTPPNFLPYSAIQGLIIRGGQLRKRARIQITHSNGVIRIPSRLNVPS